MINRLKRATKQAIANCGWGTWQSNPYS